MPIVEVCYSVTKFWSLQLKSYYNDRSSFVVAVSCDEDNKEEEQVDEEEIPPEFSAWSLMRLHPLLMKSIYHLGFKEPTEIQKACFSVAAFQGKVG